MTCRAASHIEVSAQISDDVVDQDFVIAAYKPVVYPNYDDHQLALIVTQVKTEVCFAWFETELSEESVKVLIPDSRRLFETVETFMKTTN